MRADLGEMSDEASEGRAIRQENREVIQPEQTAPRNRARALQLMEMNDFAIFAKRTEAHGINGASNDAQAEDFLVKNERSLEIRYLQPHPAQVR